jgi:two-component system, cell cycle sensor histidine kinase and response regulator CckA
VNQTEPVSETIPQPLPLTSSTQLSAKRSTILLVEDEALVREVMVETLVWAGYRVLKASNAAEARAAFRRCRKVVGLLLSDIVLPDQNGKDLAQELRMICPDLKAILVSGYPENAITRQASGEDGMLYLPKPFTADSLVQKVRLALAQENTDLAM